MTKSEHNFKFNKMNSLKKDYEEKIVKELSKEFGIKNSLAIPRVKKVVVNMGVGQIAKNKEGFKAAQENLAIITGQKPSVRQAKISVASFSLRKGMPVGLKVTLRGVRMYDFIQRFFSIVLPRLRDFRGVSNKSFDKSGNYTIGLEEMSVFPEIDITKTNASQGLEITIVTNTKDVEESKKLLELLGLPFEKEEEVN